MTKFILTMCIVLMAMPLSAKVYNGGNNMAGDPPPVIKTYGVGDLVLIQISESSESQRNVKSGGSRSTDMNAKLSKWARLSRARTHNSDNGSTKSHISKLKPAALNEPEMEIEASSSFNNQASDSYRSVLKENIYVRVADVRPNGNLFVEGHKEIRELGNIRKVSISGEVSKADLDSGETIPSYKVYDMKINIVEEGPRYNQTRKNFFQTVIEWFWPF